MVPQIIIPLITIVGSGVASVLIAFKLNARKDEKQYLRLKLEELNLALIRYCAQLNADFYPYSSAMAGKITYNQALDIIINSKVSDMEIDKILMILNLYFPHLKFYFERIQKAKSLALDVTKDFKNYYQNIDSSSEKHYKAIRDAFDLLDEWEKKFLEVIQLEATKINKRW